VETRGQGAALTWICTRNFRLRRAAYRTNNGQVYASTNFGLHWALTSAPTANWTYVASSADGSKLVAVVYGGPIYTWQSWPMLGITLRGGDVFVKWPSLSASDNLVLQRNSDLIPLSWTNMTAVLSATNGFNEVRIPSPSGQQFYRLAKTAGN
jgi:hypothetical protein